jgi:hypothetical protein
MTFYEGPKGDFFLGEFRIDADGRAVKIASATESYARNAMGEKNPVSAALATDGDPQTGWSTSGREGEAHEAVFQFEARLGSTRELRVTMQFGRHYACSLGRFRISVTSDLRGAEARGLPDEIVRGLRLPDAALSAAERDRLRTEFLLSAPELAGERKELDRIRRSPPRPPTTLVMRERPPENPRPTFIRNRGEYLQPGERVEPGVFAFLPPLDPNANRDRLAAARWLVSAENPLTSRVVVNRAWAAFFGRGIVKTTEDFGFQGESPTHPELLDWLADEFVRQGWSLKKLHRLIVTSATYRQASRVPPDLLARDPENRLLARGPRGRIDAEIVRDAALHAAGLLTPVISGPSVRPPQPEGASGVAYSKPKWEASQGGDRYRRGLYTFAQRTDPYAMATTFDAPTGEACVVRRDVSNTPLQALTLLNDVVFIEAAQALGKQLAAQPGPAGARITALFRRIATRPPMPDELADLERFFDSQRRHFAANAADAVKAAGGSGADIADRAAWTALARAIMNLDEAVTKS